MFWYRPPKSSCWGHALRPANPIQAIRKADVFFKKYFEPLRPTELTLRLNSLRNEDPYLQTIQGRAAEQFGAKGLTDQMTWSLRPEDFQRVVDFVLACDPPPTHLADPARLFIQSDLIWKSAALPGGGWPEEFAGTEYDAFRRPLAVFNFELRGRVSLLEGLTIPVAVVGAGSYEFLSEFSNAAPFKMSTKHFHVVSTAKNGEPVLRKPSAEMVAKLAGAV
jgi:hypothetical protein